MAYPDILTADDYDAIRALLGVEEIDVPDDLVDRLPFGPQAERRIQLRLPTWQVDREDAIRGLLIRMSTAYAAAAFIAESYVQGGTVGLIRGAGATSRSRADWIALAASLWARSEEEIVALAVTVIPAMYDLGGLRVGGPTRTYNQGAYGRAWWRYPPVYGGLPITRDH